MAEEISKLKIGFQLDSSQIEKGLGFVLSNLNLMQKEFKSTMVGVDKFNKSLDDLGKESEGLKGILQQQKYALETIQNEYDKVAKAKGEDSKEAMKLRAKYIDMTTQIKRTEQQIVRVTEAYQKKQQEQEEAIKQAEKEASLQTKLGKAFSSTTQALGKMNTTLNGASKNLMTVGNKITGVTANLITMTVKAGLAASALGVALGGAALKQSIDMANSVSDLQIQLGITHEQAERLQGVAKGMWKQGWGELPDITKNIAIIKQQIRELSDKELTNVTKATMLMNKQFGTDTTEVTRTIDTMMKNLGVSSTEATDILIAGFQNGLNSTGEWLDTMREYSPQFAEMGITGQQAFNIMKEAMDSGAWSLDKVADLLKEGHIRMQDMSKGSVAAYEAMGLNAEKYSNRIAKGGTDGAKALQEVMGKLEGVKSATERDALAVALFGTQYEDLREDIMWAMADGMKSTEKLGNVTKNATDVAEKSFGQRMTAAINNFKDAFTPLGEVLLELAEKHMPDIEKAIDTFAEKIKEVDWAKLIEQGKELINTVFPPLKEAFTNVVNIIKNMDDNTKSTVATIGILGVILGPVLAILGTLGTIVTTVFRAFQFFGGAMRVAVSLFTTIGSFLAPVLMGALNALWVVVKVGVQLIGKSFVGVWKLLTGTFKTIITVGRILLVVITGISAPVWIAIAAITAIIAIGVLLYKNWDTVMRWCRDLGKTIGSVFSNAWKSIKDFFGGIGTWFSEKWNSVIKGISTFKTNIEKNIKEIIGKVTKPFEDIDLLEVGKDIIRGLGKGITDMGGWIKEKIESIGEKLPKWLMKLLGIHSPSRVFADLGQWIPKGLAVGIEDGTGSVERAANKMGLATIPNIPDASIPASARNGIYGNQQNYHSNFSPTITINGSNNPYIVAQEQERLMRRMRFQGGIGRS
ncbi:phage tail tape measure protein [Cytobacillus firmus]|uniref:phage tail tape measure protein n=1 Tax=Cytobacillus firmus TaxID=1399 RepID=UPI0018CD79E0|nr:phage tail tape measure protein [Cytobacillus firmus]MBG9657096.1 hypothetical protein [Cytobacillus firmus]MED1906771.1 phage tail tape measure protein [Cytobacillus firmus]